MNTHVIYISLFSLLSSLSLSLSLSLLCPAVSLSVLGLLEKSGTHCLNASAEHPLSHALAGTGSLESADDAQLLLTLAFREPVKCATLVLSSTDDGRAPKSLKLFVNQPHVDFSQADDDAPTAAFELLPVGASVDVNSSSSSSSSAVRRVAYTRDEAGVLRAVLPLHYVHFQKVTSLSVFVEDNLGGEETSVLTSIDVLSGEKPVQHVPFVATLDAFEKLLAASGEKTVFVDFTAGWCGPCKLIAPVFQKLSEETPGAAFVKVDVDANKETAQKFGVSAMPTFFAFKRGAKVAEMRGADEVKLRQFVDANK